jgi:hypothetical protein
VSMTVYETELPGFTREGVEAAVNPLIGSAAEAPDATSMQATAAVASSRRRRDMDPFL